MPTPAKQPPTPDLAAEVSALSTMGLPELRRVWRTRFGEPPKLRSVELLRHLLAWRIQAAALGGLDRQTRQALKRSARSGAQGRLRVGVWLACEHGGVEHQVQVVDDGFRYRGRVYASMSVISRAITGTRWNGWRFFGLAEVKA